MKMISLPIHRMKPMLLIKVFLIVSLCTIHSSTDAFVPILSYHPERQHHHHHHHKSSQQQKLQFQTAILPSSIVRTSTTKRFFQNGVDRDGEGNPVTRTTTTTTTDIAFPPSPKKIRRSYESFYWEHSNGKEYKINYRVEGDKEDPPILLLHGFGANLGHFRHQFPTLTKAGYRVYAMDLLGFGASDKPSDKEGDVKFSIELFGDLVHDFIHHVDQHKSSESTPTSPTTTDTTEEANHGRSWVLVGNSIGALCILQAAQRLQDDRVRGLVLLNCAPGMSCFRYEDVPWIVRPMLSFFQNIILGPTFGSFFFSYFKTRHTVERILKTLGVYGDTSNVDDELMELLLEPGNDVGSESVFLKVFGGDPGPTPESLLSTLHEDCPVLGLWGGADPWLSPDKGKHPATEFHKHMKNPNNFDLHILENVGHCPHDEAPELVNERLIMWLQVLPMKKKQKNP